MMPQGGPCLGSLGAVSLRTNGVSLCTANMPTRGVFRSTLCGPCLPSDGPSHSSQLCLCTPTVGASCGGVLCGACFGLHSHLHSHSHGGSSGALSPCLHMPSFGGSCGGVLDLPESLYGNSSSWSSLHSTLFALGSNASGLAVVASTAPLAGLTLAMPSVGASAVCASNDTLPGSHMLMTACLVASTPAFSAV